MNKPYKICLDIGGTKILGVIFNENDEIIYRLKKRTKGSGEGTENVEQTIINVVAEMVKKSGISLKQVQGIAAGAPGVIDQENGIILFSPNLPWRDYDIRTPLEKKFKVPFYIGNDVNIGILGEYKHGAGQGYTNVIGFFVGTGMGGGLILDGKLYTGSHFKGAEYGHMILDPEGPVCNCGQRGCLEAFSSKQGITKYIRRQASRGRETMMLEHLEGGTFRSKYLKQALRKKDPVSVEAVNRACHWLAVATGNMINTFSPDVVIYGGGVVEATGETFVKKILKEVDNYCMPSIRSTVELKSAALGDDSIVYGALSLIEDAQNRKAA
ncbi:MAG: ROK family protein [Erysipelotrichaceae bacterium]|nr:ROK family protein [Erysipelotrichaceae bacterium]